MSLTVIPGSLQEALGLRTVRFDRSQSLTDAQKAQACANIGARVGGSTFTGTIASTADPATDVTLDTSGSPIKTIVNTGALVLPPSSGLYFVHNVTDHEMALYFCNYANVFLLAQGAAGFSATNGAVSGKLSMGYTEGGRYAVYNSSGADKQVQVSIISARATA